MLELNCAMSYKNVPKAYNQCIPVISDCDQSVLPDCPSDIKREKGKNLSMFKQHKHIFYSFLFPPFYYATLFCNSVIHVFKLFFFPNISQLMQLISCNKIVTTPP